MRTNRDRKISGLLLILLILVQPLPSRASTDIQLPDFGDASGNVMTPAEEEKLGKAFMRSVRATEAVLDDLLLQDYIQDLGDRLTRAGTNANQRFRFFLIDNPRINAFAGPAGYIGVYSGLLMTTETESELAAVLAHEIAHVTQNHLRRAWHAAGQMSIPQAAVLLAAAVLGLTVGGDAAIAAATAGQASMIQQQINFTRANEKEADRVGIGILAEADFEPRAMPGFFARMGHANRIYASKLPEYLMTHPVTNARIADSQGRAETYPYRQRPEDLRYHLTRAALRARDESDPLAAIRIFEGTLRDGRFRNEQAERYGLALALYRAKRYAAAAEILDQLIADRPQQVEFLVSKARVDGAQGQYQRAIAALRAALARSPGNLPLSLTLADLLVAADEPRPAYDMLRELLDRGLDEVSLYRAAARAAGESGLTALAHGHMAEYRYASGDLDAAILQLEIALREPELSDFETARLQSRLRDLRIEQAASESGRRAGR
jgi:predicted Zn-dependent protease